MRYQHLIALAGFVLAAAEASAQAQPAPSPSAPPPPAATPTPEHAGFVKTLRGDVQLLGANGVARPARAGEPLAPAERLVTAADAAASAVLRDGTALVVGPSSRLDLKAFSFDATTHEGGLLVALLQGSLRMVTGLIGKAHPEAVRVETKTAFIGIRGTDFIVQADAQP